MKKILSGFVALVLLLFLTLPAQAAVSAPPLSQISSNPNYAGASWSLTAKSAGFAISFASSNLWKVNSTTVYVSATTQATQIMDEVGGTIRLQKWVDNAWKTVTSRGFYNCNRYESSGSTTLTVEPGYYYRVQTYHYADYDMESVSKFTTTSSIFVN